MAVVELLVPNLTARSAGNTVTARRYTSMLGTLGHDVRTVAAPSVDADLVIAMNAHRSATGINAVPADTPVVVVLTGTDIYRFVLEQPEPTLASLDRATRLVGLNSRAGDAVPARFRQKLMVIKEGARPGLPRSPDPDRFLVAAVGHLRDEKEPALLAEVARALPRESTVEVHHYGGAHTPAWAAWAAAETAANRRFHWHGEVSSRTIERVYASSHLLVNTSRIEGGANAISEAIMAGLPVLASDIDGNVGVLGERYPGYFPAGDVAALCDRLSELTTTPAHLESLATAVEALQPMFTETVERTAWATLLADLDVV